MWKNRFAPRTTGIFPFRLARKAMASADLAAERLCIRKAHTDDRDNPGKAMNISGRKATHHRFPLISCHCCFGYLEILFHHHLTHWQLYLGYKLIILQPAHRKSTGRNDDHGQ